MARTLILAAVLLGIAAIAAKNRPYQCHTDIECEAEEAARCWILCQ